ncbi:MAG: CPBP family intramembrane glutamic endopeptidase [Oscillospiraceae bacterium]
MKELFKNVEVKRISFYLLLTFALTYIYEIAVVWKAVNSENLALQQAAQMLIPLAMFIPAICVVIVTLVTKNKFSNLYIKFNFKGNIKYYLLAWFLPSLLILVGSLTYFLIFRDKFDANMTYMLNLFAQSGAELTKQQLLMNFFTQMAIGILFSPILNAITCFGEELGWRGFLLPKMLEKFKLLPTLLITGIIWGLWHAPMTMIGHNYGTEYWGFPYVGIIAMCIFCIVIGTILSYVTIKTKSCFPAVIIHGSLNGLVSAGLFFSSDGGNSFIGPMPTGIIGGIGFIIAAIIMMVLLVKEEKQKA